jgi:hypothetical protein
MIPLFRHTVISRSSPIKGREVITLTGRPLSAVTWVGAITTALYGLVVAVAVFMSGNATAAVHQAVALIAMSPLPVAYPARTPLL